MITYVFLRNIFGGMGSSAPIFQHMWKLDNLVMTVPLLIISKNYFLFIFDHFLLIMLLLIFKSLLRVVAWKCQIVKCGLSFKNKVQWKYCFFYFLQPNDHFNERHHDLQHFAKYVPHFIFSFYLSLSLFLKWRKINKKIKDVETRV